MVINKDFTKEVAILKNMDIIKVQCKMVMKKIFLTVGVCAGLLLASCNTTSASTHFKPGYMPPKSKMILHQDVELSPKEKYIVARITFYNRKEAGGDRLAMGGRAKEGISVAAHPDFKFGTKIQIPSLAGKIGNGNFIVQDRGTAVTKKKASHGKAYVFDIYVNANSKREGERRISILAKQFGDYVEVIIPKHS